MKKTKQQKNYFAPGAVSHYKARNAKHLVRWMLKCVVFVVCMSILAGAVRGCTQPQKPTAQQKKVTT